MGEQEIIVFFLSVGLVVLLFIMAICLVITSQRKRQLYFMKESENAALKHRKELLEARQEIQQSLMQQLGAELHDTVGQKLTLAYLQMENARYLDDINKIKDHISLQNVLIQESLDELRSLSKILISHDFSDFSFVHFLSKEMDRLEQSGLVKTVFIAPAHVPKLANERIELTLARICQEFIQNSLKHSGCTVIKIEIEPGQEKMVIHCNDNGKGIDWQKGNKYDVRSGTGLQMINTRVSSIGGTCAWGNEQGASLVISLPLDSNIMV
jgi:signal transduction histidine kinase